MRTALSAGVLALSFVAANPAQAATVLTGTGICNQTTATAYTSCVAYSGNLLNNSSIGDINIALDALYGGNYSPNVLWANLDPTSC